MFYVYALCNPLVESTVQGFEFQPFYIGYGKNNRMYDHKRKVDRIDKLNSTNNTYKNIILMRLKEFELQPIYVKLNEKLSADDAKRFEIYYISLLGRKDLGTGILGNLTDGGDGISNISEETRRRMSDSHKGKIPPNLEQFRSWHLNLSSAELSKKMSKAVLSKNNGVKKPPRRKSPKGMSRSEISSLREANKSIIQKEEIRKKISIKKQGIEPSNKQIKNGSVEQQTVAFLFDCGLSCKFIQKFYYPKISISAISSAIITLLGDVKLYRRQSESDALDIINKAQRWNGQLPQVTGSTMPMINIK